MKKGVLLGLAYVFLVLYLSSFISAAASKDIGYILINKRSANKQITDIFSSLNLTYDLIEDNKINLAYKSGNLSNYRFLFIDDVRLSNARNLPIYNYSSVIMNEYYGFNWGLTNRNGESQFTSIVPINLKLPADGREQVYTQSRYTITDGYIPVYYLPDANKAGGFTSIARVFEGGGADGNNPTRELGDAIAYANRGTILVNGKTTGGKTCFFGIAKTGFWTDNAKNLFLDCLGFAGTVCRNDSECPSPVSGAKYCLQNRVFQNTQTFSCENPGTVHSQCVSNIIPVNLENCTGKTACINGGCVSITCNRDSDCDDNNNHTKDTCLNPGTIISSCKHENIPCLNDLECGTNGFIGDLFCINSKNLTRQYRTFSCNNPASTLSYCTNSTVNQLLQTCSDACIEGECKNITCYKDSDCNDNNNQTEDHCLNPGTYISTCSHLPINCFADSDCGKNGLINTPFCVNNKNVTQQYITFMCNNPGTSSSVCTNSTSLLVSQTCKDYCDGGQCFSFNCSQDSDCNDGNVFTEDRCINPSSPSAFCQHNPIKCFTGVDCGINHVSGNTCSGNDIVKNFLNFTCTNPGTSGSFCANFSGSYIQQTCDQKCQAGQCVSINCSQNSDCNDNDARTVDSCVNPGTTASFCRNTEVNCLNDADCGFTGFTGTEFCFQNEVFKYLQNATCVNPGTLNSNCVISQGPLLLQNCNDNNPLTADSCSNGQCFNQFNQCTNNSDCGSIEVINSYCIGKQVWQNNSIPQCNSGKCAVNFSQTLKENCSDECDSGQCASIACSQNSDCGTNYLSGNICSGLNVIKNYLNYSCNNPGTSSSSCSNSTGTIQINNCPQKCASGQCVSFNCSQDSDCNDNDARTVDSCVNPGTTASFCRNTEVNCLNDADCGFTGFTGTEFCFQNEVFKYLQNATCVNPGTLNSNCNINAFPLLRQDCNDNNPETTDSCIETSTSAFCQHNLTEINCSQDSDCTGAFFVHFCKENDLWNRLGASHCVNPGTSNSRCEVNISETFNSDCGASTSSIVCVGDNLTNVTNLRGCSDAGCVNNTLSSVITECPNGCSDRACINNVTNCTSAQVTAGGNEFRFDNDIRCSGLFGGATCTTPIYYNDLWAECPLGSIKLYQTGIFGAGTFACITGSPEIIASGIEYRSDNDVRCTTLTGTTGHTGFTGNDWWCTCPSGTLKAYQNGTFGNGNFICISPLCNGS